MLTECNPTSMRFARLKGRDVVADFGSCAMIPDAGALLLGAPDRATGLVARFSACFSDGRAADRVVHDVEVPAGQRVFGIALATRTLTPIQSPNSTRPSTTRKYHRHTPRLRRNCRSPHPRTKSQNLYAENTANGKILTGSRRYEKYGLDRQFVLASLCPFGKESASSCLHRNRAVAPIIATC